MTPLFKAWFGGLLITVLLVSISVEYLDKPIAILIHNAFGPWHLPQSMVHSPAFSIPLAAALMVLFSGFSAVLGRSLFRFEIVILFCAIAVLVTDTAKNQLKYVFGRTWPDSWEPQILSLVRDNVYGFNFFHHGRSFESFPSGHAALAASVMSILWIFYPRLGLAWAICLGSADIGLVLLNLHFLSDVVAGTFLGVSTGTYSLSPCVHTDGRR
jgi:membrane-associated phospholipid phosphatase